MFPLDIKRPAFDNKHGIHLDYDFETEAFKLFLDNNSKEIALLKDRISTSITQIKSGKYKL